MDGSFRGASVIGIGRLVPPADWQQMQGAAKEQQMFVL